MLYRPWADYPESREYRLIGYVICQGWAIAGAVADLDTIRCEQVNLSLLQVSRIIGAVPRGGGVVRAPVSI